MTSPTMPGIAQEDLEGRSVRDVVEYSPEQVDDAWCRKILRKILQSLELQYAMQMPHRAITPDTILFHANGEPLLISDDIDAAPAPDSRLADDLTALARVLHYAITQELAPVGPLAGRSGDYSAALVATIDACMDPDPGRRPRSIDAVRGLLGIVAPEPPAGVVTLSEPPAPRLPTSASPSPSATSTASALPPAFTPVPAEPVSPDPDPGETLATVDASPDAGIVAPHVGMRRSRRWAIAAGGGAIAVAIAVLLPAEFRDAGSNDHAVLTPQQTGGGTHPGRTTPDDATSRTTVATEARTDQVSVSASGDPARVAATVPAHDPAGDAVSGTASNVASGMTANPPSDRVASPASGASSGGTTLSGPVDQRDDAPAVASKPTAVAGVAAPAGGGAAASTRAAVSPGTVPGKASYQLHIKPWGIVYVDGVDQGASPPLKRLALTPGQHTIRITNPQYRDSILEFESALTTNNGRIIVEFTEENQ